MSLTQLSNLPQGQEPHGLPALRACDKVWGGLYHFPDGALTSPSFLPTHSHLHLETLAQAFSRPLTLAVLCVTGSGPLSPLSYLMLLLSPVATTVDAVLLVVCSVLGAALGSLHSQIRHS